MFIDFGCLFGLLLGMPLIPPGIPAGTTIPGRDSFLGISAILPIYVYLWEEKSLLVGLASALVGTPSLYHDSFTLAIYTSLMSTDVYVVWTIGDSGSLLVPVVSQSISPDKIFETLSAISDKTGIDIYGLSGGYEDNVGFGSGSFTCSFCLSSVIFLSFFFKRRC